MLLAIIAAITALIAALITLALGGAPRVSGGKEGPPPAATKFLKGLGRDAEPFSWFDELPARVPRLELSWQPRESEQRKLFLSHLRVLSMMEYVRPLIVIVYNAAGPGTCVPLLMDLLNELDIVTQWHLYGGGFGKVVRARASKPLTAKELEVMSTADIEAAKTKCFINLYEEPLTEREARSWAERCDVFISDRNDREDWEFFKCMGPPNFGTVPFRLAPGEEAHTPKGRLMLQSWAPPGETRLVMWDCDEETRRGDEYHARVRWFDEIARKWGRYRLREFRAHRKALEAQGIDWCHDCALELLTWRAFFAPKKIPALMKRLSALVGPPHRK